MSAAKKASNNIKLTIGEWRTVLLCAEGNGENDNKTTEEVVKKVKAVLDTIDKRYLEDLGE